jgi:hypothetical protein
MAQVVEYLPSKFWMPQVQILVLLEKKVSLKDYKLCGSNYMTVWTRSYYGENEKISNCQKV